MSSAPKDSPTPLAEIVQGPSAFEQFLDRNQKGLVVLAILIVLAAATMVVVQGVKDSSRKTAGEEMFRAKDAAGYQKVATDHKGTPAGGTAMVLLANQQWADGQQEPAIETLRSFIAGNAGHPAAPTAKATLAARLMTQGKAAEAAAAFSELVDAPEARFIAPYALLCLGDMAATAGDRAKAEEHYKRAVSDFPGSGFQNKLNERIAMLGAKAPTEIEPPPPPAPATPPTPAPGITPLPEGGATPTPAPSAPPASDATPSGQPAAPAAPEPASTEPANSSSTPENAVESEL